MAPRDRKNNNETKSRENRDAIKQAAIKQAAVRSASRLTREQKYMLTHLTPAQMKAWNAYSPAHQQKIMHDVQKRIDRRMSVDRLEPEDRPEKTHHTMERIFPEEKESEKESIPVTRIYRARGHPSGMELRIVREAEFRQKKAVFRGRVETTKGLIPQNRKERKSGQKAENPRKLEQNRKAEDKERKVLGKRNQGRIQTHTKEVSQKTESVPKCYAAN